MRPEQRLALDNICKTQEDLQTVWDNPAIFKFNHKYQAWVTLCLAEDGPDKHLVWTTAVRLANPVKRNFKAVALWTISERLKARSILLDQLEGVGALLGEEEYTSTKAMHLNRMLTPKEKGIILAPHILGN